MQVDVSGLTVAFDTLPSDPDKRLDYIAKAIEKVIKEEAVSLSEIAVAEAARLLKADTYDCQAVYDDFGNFAGCIKQLSGNCKCVVSEPARKIIPAPSN